MTKKELAIFTVLLLLVSIVFTRRTAYLLFSLAGAWILFQLLVKRSQAAVILLVSLAASAFLFEHVGGRILKMRISKEYFAELSHYPKPDAGKGFNEDGVRTFRGRPPSAFRREAFNILFLGDSFTQGYMVRKDESFPLQLGELLEQAHPSLEFNIANFGWISASPLLSYARLEALGGKYRPDLVALCLDMTDFHDDVKYRDRLENPKYFSPFTFFLYRFNLAQRWLEFKKGFRFHDPQPLVPEQRYFIVNQPLEKSRRYLAEIEGNIGRIEAFAREKLGAKFVLVMLPRHIQYNPRETPRNRLEPGEYDPHGPYVMEPFRWLDEFSQRAGFPVHSLLDDFRNSGVFPTCYESDPHWNRQGHAVAARGMIRILRELALKRIIAAPLGAGRP